MSMGKINEKHLFLAIQGISIAVSSGYAIRIQHNMTSEI